MKNPAWTRDELILALNLYFQHGRTSPAKNHPDILKLSKQLNQLNVGLTGKDQSFRNPNGVYMKLNNFKSIDPNYTKEGKVGLWRKSKGDQAVWTDFANDPKKLSQVATAIIKNLRDDDFKTSFVYAKPTFIAREGRLLTQIHKIRERNRSLVLRKKQEALHLHGILKCEACGFVFSDKYGRHGEGIIEVHHNIPLHTLTPSTETTLKDLTLLCSNCHRVIHSKKDFISVENLKQFINQNKQ